MAFFSNGEIPVGAALPREIEGGYRLLEALSEGQIATVYRATRLRDEAQVAVKLLHPNQGQVIADRFMREVRLLAGIDNPHVVDVLSFGRTGNGEIYLVMEFLEGTTAEHQVEGRGPLSPRDACHVGAQIARAMQKVHQTGVVHRDIKPSNILFVEEDEDPFFVKILDFGIAKHEGEGVSLFSGITAVAESREMQAPEQVKGDPTDARTDVYGVGLLLYYLLTGIRPFAASSAQALVKNILHTQPDPPSTLMPPGTIPPGLDALLEKCMSKSPADRFEDMTELLRALNGIDFSPPGEDDASVSGVFAAASDSKTPEFSTDDKWGDVDAAATIVDDGIAQEVRQLLSDAEKGEPEFGATEEMDPGSFAPTEKVDLESVEEMIRQRHAQESDDGKKDTE
jgi:serine/threonine-protein kinase